MFPHLWKAAMLTHTPFFVHCQHCTAIKHNGVLHLGTYFYYRKPILKMPNEVQDLVIDLLH